MDGNDFIQVLWVEDDPKVTMAYPLEAENYDLQLVPFSCWDDAKAALERDFEKWSAIILDAKCKYHRDSADNAIVFLGEALVDISTICEKKGRIIPWYVLTGGSETEVSDSINDKRLKWDSDWTEKQHKKYYSKNVDNESLYERIKSHAQKSHSIQIREMYRDAFKQLSLLNSEDVCEDIATIFTAMHFPGSTSDFIPRLFYNPLRKGLEYIFRAANRVGIIPDVFLPSGVVNLNQCFMFLIGKDAEKIGFRYGNQGERIAPSYIQNMMKLILSLGNVNSHSQLSEKELQDIDDRILKEGMSSKYLIFSMALQLCEIASWMNRYITEHPNKDDNLLKCQPLPTSSIDEKKKEEEIIGIIEYHNGFYHIGEKYILSPKVVQQRNWSGKTVKIVKFDKNTNDKSKGLFPFFATKIQPLEEADNGSQ